MLTTREKYITNAPTILLPATMRSVLIKMKHLADQVVWVLIFALAPIAAVAAVALYCVGFWK